MKTPYRLTPATLPALHTSCLKWHGNGKTLGPRHIENEAGARRKGALTVMFDTDASMLEIPCRWITDGVRHQNIVTRCAPQVA